MLRSCGHVQCRLAIRRRSRRGSSSARFALLLFELLVRSRPWDYIREKLKVVDTSYGGRWDTSIRLDLEEAEEARLTNVLVLNVASRLALRFHYVLSVVDEVLQEEFCCYRDGESCGVGA